MPSQSSTRTRARSAVTSIRRPITGGMHRVVPGRRMWGGRLGAQNYSGARGPTTSPSCLRRSKRAIPIRRAGKEASIFLGLRSRTGSPTMDLDARPGGDRQWCKPIPGRRVQYPATGRGGFLHKHPRRRRKHVHFCEVERGKHEPSAPRLRGHSQRAHHDRPHGGSGMQFERPHR